MFMFWSKRAALTRRLLKAKVRGEHETECETQEDTFSRINVQSTNNITQQKQQQQQVETTRAQKSAGYRGNTVTNRFHQGCCGGDLSHDEDDEQLRVNQTNNQQQQEQRNIGNRLTRCKDLLKSLKENQLEMLLKVVESYGSDFGSCVLVPRKQQIAGSRSFTTLDNDTTTSAPIITLKQQEQPVLQHCNRHQRCGLASSFYDNTSTRRVLPHRRALRSRRHNQGARCARCVNSHTGANSSGGSSDEQRAGSRDDFSSSFPTTIIDDDLVVAENRDNEINQRIGDNSTKCRSFFLDDRRQEQPAWSNTADDFNDDNSVTTGFNDSDDNNHVINETAGASRPERDRCRRRRDDKINASWTTTGARKRRDSSPSVGENFNSVVDSTYDDPHLLSCQTWRWPDLANSSELKKLPVCHSAKDPVYVCCNPYHWSRLCKPESPPPPYCLIPDRLRPEDRAPSEIGSGYRRCGIMTSPQPHSGSLATNGEGDAEMGQKEWCTLAYWELGGRVGRLYPVEPSTVNVFDSLHDGDGLCLATLAESHVATPAVQRTRSKIGLGLMLSQEPDGVWAYNRSESPIFVNSPTLDDPESRTLLVYRVPPGFCLNIFDRAKTIQLPRCIGESSPISASFNSGPIDVNSVRISFAKGWGPKYSRQEVTSCPCWLEVLLAPCR